VTEFRLDDSSSGPGRVKNFSVCWYI